MDATLLCRVKLCRSGEACAAETYDTGIANCEEERVEILDYGRCNAVCHGHKAVTLDSYSHNLSSCRCGEGLDLSYLTGYGGVDGR